MTLVVIGGFAFALNESQGANAKDLDFDCFAPARIDGAVPGQGGVLRCYLQALADHDASEMKAVMPADELGGTEAVAAATFRFSAAARSGIASVLISQNPDETAIAQARIRFADGEVDVQTLEIVDPTSCAGWRLWATDEHHADDVLGAG